MYRLRFERRAVGNVVVQRFQQCFGGLDALRRAGQLEFVAAIANAHTHTALDELEVLIERPTQRGEAKRIVRHERHTAGQRNDSIRLVRQTTVRMNI